MRVSTVYKDFQGPVVAIKSKVIPSLGSFQFALHMLKRQHVDAVLRFAASHALICVDWHITQPYRS